MSTRYADYSHVRFPFGKHAGKTLDLIPTHYLAWAASEAVLEGWLMRAVEYELERRSESGEQSAGRRRYHTNSPTRQVLPLGADFEIALKMLEAGRRKLAQTHHPDAGGDAAAMVTINCTADYLSTAIADLFGEAAR